MATLTLTKRLETLADSAAVPAQYTAAPSGDAAVMAAWKLSPMEWAALTHQERINYRWNVAKALQS